MHIDGLDELDNKILTVIEKNARLSYSDIGEQVGLSRVSVKTRMDAMEKKGVIEGYYTKINAESAPEGHRFFLEVITEPGQYEEVIDRIASQQVIKRVYAVSGECRLLVEGFASKRLQYENFMRNIKNNAKGVRSMVTMDAHYPIKNVYGGVDYMSLAERRAKIATAGEIVVEQTNSSV